MNICRSIGKIFLNRTHSREEWFYFKLEVSSIGLPFHGEPLEGIQIMGILESRNLDFKYVIILSMEEGKFPPNSSTGGSLIPFNIRSAFHLPTFKETDAEYAYYFYRLFQESERVWLLYNPVRDGTNQGGKSRFLLQIEAEWKLNPVKSYSVVQEGIASILEPVQIPKTPDVLEKLSSYLINEDNPNQKYFSPSALNSYLDCSLRFYYKYIAGLSFNQKSNGF